MISNLPNISNASFRKFLIAQNVLNQYYTIKSQETQLSKYVIKAPFDGVLSSGNLSVGTVIRAGQPLGTFVNTTNMEIEVGFTSNQIKQLQIGSKAQVYSPEKDRYISATVTRISRTTNPSTQTQQVYLQLSKPIFQAGQFVNGSVQGKPYAKTMRIANELIVETNKAYTVYNDSLQLNTLEIVYEETEQSIVKNLPSNHMLLNQPMPSAQPGMLVQSN